MSSQADIATIIGEVLSRQVANYCSNAGSTLVVYEYFITLRREVQLFWRGKWTGAAILFFFNRYLSLIVYIYGFAGNAHISAQVCPGEIKGIKIIDIMQYLPWAVFSTLRAFALSHNYLLAVFVFCLSIVPIPINFTHFAKGLTGVIDPIVGCINSDNVSPVTIISRTCLITADLLLVCVTWANLYRRGGLRQSFEMNRFIAVLLLDGIVLLVLNTLHLTLSMLSVEYGVQNGSYVTQFSEPLTTILISRFLLDLQSANRKASNPQGTTTISVNDAGPGALVFERVIGSLGSSIGIDPVVDEYKSSFDNDGDGGRLTIQVKDLMGRGGKDDPDSSVDSEGRSGVEMTPLSSPRSPAETSDSERVLLSVV
ncbi:hypothetical protein V8D89_002852 [Ganoderma adspersum]